MENYKNYENRLHQFLSCIQDSKFKAPDNCDAYGLALFDCERNFMGRYMRSLIIVKKRIVDLVQDRLCDLQESQLAQLQKLLKSFTVQHKSFITQGILNTYFSLVDCAKAYQSQNHEQKNTVYINLLKQIMSQMKPIILLYFTYRQYKRRPNTPQIKIQKNKIGSQKRFVYSKDRQKECDNVNSNINVNQVSLIYGEEQIKNQVLLKEIQEQLQVLTITQLINKYLKEEQDNLVDSIQVCRVCSQKIKLRNFQKHMKTCSKKAKIKGQFKQLEAKTKKLYEEILELENKLIVKNEGMGQRQAGFRKIILMIKRLFFKPSNKDRLRRNTQFMGPKKQPIQQIKHELKQFEQKYEKDPLLHNIIKSKQQIMKTRKKLQLAQINFQIEAKSNKASQISSFKSLYATINKAKSKSKKKLKTKKSLFASKVQNEDNNSKQMSKQQKNNKSFSSYSSISISASQKSQEQQNSFCSVIQEINKRKKNNPVKTEFYVQSVENIEGMGMGNSKETLVNSMKDISNKEEDLENQKMGLGDFQILKFLGKGAFGRVYLVRRKATKDLYALKHIKLENAQTPSQMQLIRKQHEIFKKIAGDHLIRAPFAFTESFGHFFVLQFMPGGDLSKILTEQVYLTQDQAKFYLAEIVLAVEHLHKCQIIHRDLKPQNIVLDKNGHIKLTDFGLSDIKIQDKIIKAKQKKQLLHGNTQKQRNNRRVALVNRSDIDKIIGTPDYIAPQIINQTSINNQSIDWWSLGVIAYEMMIGCRPFSAMTIDQVLRNIIQCKIEWPVIGREEEMMSPEAYDLISKFLDPNFQKRIGSISCLQIKNHPFFKQIDWQNIKNQQPPLMPLSQLSQLQNYTNLSQDEALLAQITKTQKNKDQHLKKCINLQNFVRYDVLLQQTYQSVDQKLKSQKQKIQRIITIGSFIEDQEKQKQNSIKKSSENTTLKYLINKKNQKNKNKQKNKIVSFFAYEIKDQ